MKIRNSFILLAAILILPFTKAYSHCEVPCGIYEDEMRVEMIREHITTIQKAMKEIEALSEKKDALSMNQMVRWINTKEDHANQIQHIITQYFMTQRVQLDVDNPETMEKNIELLRNLHKMLVYSMKMKQSLDPELFDLFNESLSIFEKSYFGEAAHRHNSDGSHK